ncbi:OmpH family outer membrane protein [Desulfovibrio sp. OttesenSCG-928-C14]|nr:OmpH family outer membrane protein [Desulfovibrio sp. OttesenSCG-928-C14]
MRKFFLLLLAFCFMAGTAQAAAPAQQPLKIGVFNMAEVALECQAFKDVQKQIQSSYGQEQKRLEKAEQDLQKRFEDFSVKQGALSAEARQDRQVELMRLKRDHDDRKNDFVRKVSAAEARFREQITRAILLAAGDYGKKNKFSLIMDSNSAGAVHVEPALDITAAILKETDRIWKEKPKALTDGRPIITGAPRK